MVTDPISAPRKRPAKWIYGFIIGVLIILLRWKAQFAGGVAFAILLGNMIGPLLDLAAGAWAARRAAPQPEKALEG
jgi:Na+-translocating ferredoxin:NAD+ oxidoreductase RnfD subunit